MFYIVVHYGLMETNSASISIRLKPSVKQEISHVAQRMDRTNSWVIEQAINDYLAVQAWQIKAIEAGIASADRGELTPHEEVVAQFRGRHKKRPQ
jgi:predicted transcriptional regulator